MASRTYIYVPSRSTAVSRNETVAILFTGRARDMTGQQTTADTGKACLMGCPEDDNVISRRIYCFVVAEAKGLRRCSNGLRVAHRSLEEGAALD